MRSWPPATGTPNSAFPCSTGPARRSEPAVHRASAEVSADRWELVLSCCETPCSFPAFGYVPGGTVICDDRRNGGVDLAGRTLLVLTYQVALRRWLSAAGRHMAGHARITIMGDNTGHHGLVQAIGSRSHPGRGRRVPLQNLLLPVAFRPLLDLATPPPRVTRQLGHVVLRERHIDGEGHVLTWDTPTTITGVLPDPFEPDMPVQGAAHQGCRVARRGPIEGQDDTLPRRYDAMSGAGIPGSPRQPRLHASHPLAQPELTKHRFADRLPRSLDAILGQERPLARQRRIADAPGPAVIDRATVRGGELLEVER